MGICCCLLDLQVKTRKLTATKPKCADRACKVGYSKVTARIPAVTGGQPGACLESAEGAGSPPHRGESSHGHLPDLNLF